MGTRALPPPPQLRILALVTDAYGAAGGIAQYNRDLLGALDASDRVREIILLSRTGTGAQQRLPGKVRQLKPRVGRTAWAAAAIRAAWRGRPFDVVFCGHLFSVPVAALVARIAAAPLWLQLHGIEAWQRPRPLLRAAAESAQLVTSVSRYTRRSFLTWAACDPETVKVLPNTVEERFSPGASNPRLQHAYGLEGKRVLLTVSRLASAERYKGHDLVLQALARLAPAWPDIVYVIAGDGDDRPRLERLAADLNVSSSTRFIGHVADVDLPDLYRTAKVFVMPSTGEGFGIVFLQALASGIAVIAGDSDGSADPLRDGASGTLVPATDAAALTRAIDAALRRAPAVDTGHQLFNRPHFEAQVEGLISRLAGQLASA